MAQSDNINITSTVTPSGSMEFGHTLAGDMITVSHNNGSNIQITDEVTSALNTSNSQTLTQKNNFVTVKGNSSEYTGKTKESRIEGDSVEIIGSSNILFEDLQAQWYKEYQKGWGNYKEQWQDNRNSLTIDNFPINSLYNIPAGASLIKVSPPLIDGKFSDNLTKEAKAAFMEKFSENNEEIFKLNQDFQDSLNQTYNDKQQNILSVYNSTKYIV